MTLGLITALASFYTSTGHLTAFGHTYDPSRLTTACDAYPEHTHLTLSFQSHTVTVEVTDKLGPKAREKHRTFDLSPASFSALAPLRIGVIEVTIVSVYPPIMETPTFADKLYAEFVKEKVRAGSLTEARFKELCQSLFDSYSVPVKPKSPSISLGKALSDEEWLQVLREEPLLAGVDVDKEHSKCLWWCRCNANEFTRRRFLVWLGKAERTLSTVNPASRHSRVAKAEEVTYVEPQDWKNRLPEDDDDLINFRGASWAFIHPFYQKRISNKIKSLCPLPTQ